MAKHEYRNGEPIKVEDRTDVVQAFCGVKEARVTLPDGRSGSAARADMKEAVDAAHFKACSQDKPKR